MLYINKLTDLSPKTAENASTPILRELRTKRHEALGEELKIHLQRYHAQEQELELMEKALGTIPSTIKAILAFSGNKEFSQIAVKRACISLKEIEAPLKNNIDLGRELYKSQESLVPVLLNLLSGLKQPGSEKEDINNGLNFLFSALLRSSNLTFNSEGLVEEGIMNKMASVHDMVKDGSILQKELFDYTQKKESPAREMLERIAKDIETIRKGTEAAYQLNMKIAFLCVEIYAFIRWMNE